MRGTHWYQEIDTDWQQSMPEHNDAKLLPEPGTNIQHNGSTVT
jgi:hypothetical protein